MNTMCVDYPQLLDLRRRLELVREQDIEKKKQGKQDIENEQRKYQEQSNRARKAVQDNKAGLESPNNPFIAKLKDFKVK
jgi:hypothetical protein